MKKNFITGLCLLLSFTGAYAQCTNQGGCPVKSNTCCEKTNICLDKKSTCHITKEKLTCPQKSKLYRDFVNNIKRERATVYNALNLTDEQVEIREKTVKENAPVYEEKFERLMKESFRLKSLKDANASDKDIRKQEKVVKNIKKEIQDTLDKENKDFKKCLTREQRSKYAMIKKLERKDYKESCHKKDLYKNNPQMRYFGNPKTCPCE